MNRVLCLLICALGFWGCHLHVCDSAGPWAPVAGSGRLITENRPVGSFDRISLRGSSQLVVQQTGIEGVTVRADDNLIRYARAKVSGRTLRLGLKPSTDLSLEPSQPVIYFVSVKQLARVDLQGSGSVHIKTWKTKRGRVTISGSGQVAIDVIDTRDFAAELTGSGSLQARGTAERQVIKLSGSGHYEAAGLASAAARVAISGSGTAVVHAQQQLDVRLSGSAVVHFLGNPQLSTNVNGSGKVEPVDWQAPLKAPARVPRA